MNKRKDSKDLNQSTASRQLLSVDKRVKMLPKIKTYE